MTMEPASVQRAVRLPVQATAAWQSRTKDAFCSEAAEILQHPGDHHRAWLGRWPWLRILAGLTEAFGEAWVLAGQVHDAVGLPRGFGWLLYSMTKQV